MSDDIATLSKADRLAIAGQAAPAVRRRAAAPRKVTVVDRAGKPVRVTDDVEIAQAVLARADIEFSVQEGAARDWRKCTHCGLPFQKLPVKGAGRGNGGPTKVCPACVKTLSACATCGAPVSITSGYRAEKLGRLPRCMKCRPKAMPGVLAHRQQVVEDAVARRVAESVCRDCRVPLKPPSSAAMARVMRYRHPEGRRCYACAGKARRVPPKVCKCGTPIKRNCDQCRACWKARVSRPAG